MTTTIYTDGAGGPRAGCCWFHEDNREFWYRLMPPGTKSSETEWLAVIYALQRWGDADGLVVKTDASEIIYQLYDKPPERHRHYLNQRFADMVRRLLRDDAIIKRVPRKQNKAGIILDAIKAGMGQDIRFWRVYGPGDSDGKSDAPAPQAHGRDHCCVKCLAAGKAVKSAGTVRGLQYCATHMNDMVDFHYGGSDLPA